MANLSMREAVKFYHVSRPTLTKALKKGVISGVKDGQGHWSIDTVELARVYRPRKTDTDKVANFAPAKLTTVAPPLQGQFEALEARLVEAEKRAAVAEALADERGRHLNDLRRMLPPPGNSTGQRWWPFRKK